VWAVRDGKRFPVGEERTGRGQIGGSLQKQLQWFLKRNGMEEEDQQHLGCSVGTTKSSHRDRQLLAAPVLLNFWAVFMYGQMLTALPVHMHSLK